MTLPSSLPLYYSPTDGLGQAYPDASDPDGKYIASLYCSQLYSGSSESLRQSKKQSGPPPLYGSDCTVEKLTSKNRPLRPINIKFLQLSESKQRAYSNGDSVIGILQMTPTKRIQLESISISLEGEEVVRNSTRSHDQVLRRHMKLARHEIVNLPEDSQLIPGNLYNFPFSLEIPQIQSIQACADIKNLPSSTLIHQCHNSSTSHIGLSHLKLPSTTGVHPNQSVSPLTEVSSKVARVTYKLKPLINGLELDTGKTYVAVENDFFINIVPSYPLPAQFLSPSPVPYSAFRQYTKRHGLSLLSGSKKAGGVVQLVTNQYPIIPLYSREGNSTKLPLTLRYFPDRQNKTAENPSPPPVHNISLHLKARTVSSYQRSITTPVFNPAYIKTFQVDNKLHEVIDPTKGLRVNMVTVPVESLDESKPGTKSGLEFDDNNTNNIPPNNTNNSEKAKTETKLAHTLPEFKKEVKSYPISFTDTFPDSSWRLIPAQGNTSSIIIPNFNSIIPASSVSEASSVNCKYQHDYFETQITVPININSGGGRGFDLVPSYESCYTARDYTLVVSVEFSHGVISSNSSIQCAKNSMPMGLSVVLEIPAVVVTSMTPAINTPDLLAYYSDVVTLATDNDNYSHDDNNDEVAENTVEASTNPTNSNMNEESGNERGPETTFGQVMDNVSRNMTTNNTNTTHTTPVSPPPTTNTNNTSFSNTNQRRRFMNRISQRNQNTGYHRGEKYLDVSPLPPRRSDPPPYNLKYGNNSISVSVSSNGNNSNSNNNSSNGINNNNNSDYPFPPAGIGLSQIHGSTTMVTTVGNYTGNQYHRIRESNGNYHPLNNGPTGVTGGGASGGGVGSGSVDGNRSNNNVNGRTNANTNTDSVNNNTVNRHAGLHVSSLFSKRSRSAMISNMF